MGKRPWQVNDLASDMPIIHEPHPRFGWRNKPGEYAFGRVEPIRVTFWPDGTRATAPRPVEESFRIALIGDSFTEGWAVTDSQTFGWRLQERLARASVRNYGSAGYGTTQALLSLKEILAKPDARPQVVVYGFSDLHEERNVAAMTWLRSLAEVAHRGHPGVPYASLASDGSLRFHPPTQYSMWPLHEQSALVATLEGAWTQFASRGRGASGRAVTDALLLELDRAVRASGGRLIVAQLWYYFPGTEAHYTGFFAEHGVAAPDCRHPRFLAPEMQVPYYGHPNGMINAHWAACIEAAILRAAPVLAERAPP
jgi:lysophospholipase L1-like esterase